MPTNAESTRDRGIHAPIDGLNSDDPGIGLLAEAVADIEAREILLVCCGDVPGVGPQATRLVLDVREPERSIARAVPLTTVPGESFGHAIVWPRPHLGKDFTHWCLAKAASSLRPGGTLWCAARKNKGARSLTTTLGELMGEVDVVARTRGYRLMRARRTETFDPAAAQALLDARYEIEDPALPGLSLHSAPGVFSRQELDAGTRVLLEHLTTLAPSPKVVLDLCCGIGPLGLAAASRWPEAQVVMVDSNLRAAALARDNAQRHGLASRVTVLAEDGLPARAYEGLEIEPGGIDLALVNPPTHADPSTQARLVEDLHRGLGDRPEAVALLVVSRPARMHGLLGDAGARIRSAAFPRYTVLEARWS